MNEIVFTSRVLPVGHMFTNEAELRRGIARIHIVENWDFLDSMFEKVGLDESILDYEPPETFREYVERVIEADITHETIHWVLYSIIGRKACAGLDFVEEHPEIYRHFRGL